jgi:hypothetical protein
VLPATDERLARGRHRQLAIIGAVAAVTEALNAGFSDYQRLLEDDVWEPLRDAPEFRELSERLEQRE